MKKLTKILNWMKEDWKKPMNQAFLRALIVLVVAILLAGFFYYHGKSLDHGDLLDLKLAITLVLVEVPLFMFTPILYRAIIDESVKNAEATKKIKDIESHTTQLVNIIFNKLQTIRLQQKNGQFYLEVERFTDDELNPVSRNHFPIEALFIPFNALPYPQFDYALDHLNNGYREISAYLNGAIGLIELINQKDRTPNEIEFTKNGIENELLPKFRKELSKLIARLEAGEPLKGKCELGY